MIVFGVYQFVVFCLFALLSVPCFYFGFKYYINFAIRNGIIDPAGKINGVNKHNVARGGGFALVIIAIIFAMFCMFFCNNLFVHGDVNYSLYLSEFYFISIISIVLSGVFFIEDVYGVAVRSRLFTQFCIAFAGYLVLFNQINDVLYFIPVYINFPLYILSTIWFMNLYNFMDGVDLMSVMQTGFMSAVIAIFYFLTFFLFHKAGLFISYNFILAIFILIGVGVFGFFFNKTPAKLFLGDSGSIAIGYLMSVLLVKFAYDFGLIYAFILPLYYIMDTGITILKRLANKEKVWLPSYGSHYFQKAKIAGLSAHRIVLKIFIVNCILGVIAIWNYFIFHYSPLFILLIGIFLVMNLMFKFKTAGKFLVK
jgi:UDP-N-acetylmuramyl pentapeptide phosphotransferase/UDP-N-acetylglucosamine-1-phosphate transferase